MLIIKTLMERGRARMISRIIFILISGIMLTGLMSCEDPLEKLKTEKIKSEDVNAVLYTIEAGMHESDLSTFDARTVDTIRFRAKFDSSAIYQTTNPQNQGDINKLYGLSDCNTLHQVNSARFGWRWFNNQLEIWAYTYNDSVRKYTLVGKVSLNEFNTYEIIFSDKKYIFSLNEKLVELPRHCSETANGYKLYPYFGGDETAPHEVRVWIDDMI
jgi:hypothetical protein